MNKQINIREALDWYLWAGVNETCGDLPCLTGETEKFFSQATIKSVPAQVLSGKQASGQPTGRAGNLSFSEPRSFAPTAQTSLMLLLQKMHAISVPKHLLWTNCETSCRILTAAT